MVAPNVLIVFYSRGGLTERLAVLLAEGAIQGGANIRLRRSRDTLPEELIAADEGWRVNRDRMHGEFAAPRVEDVAWADVVAFGTPAFGEVSVELAATLEVLRLAGLDFEGKAATVFTSSYGLMDGAEDSLRALQDRLLGLGFTVMPGPKISQAMARPVPQSAEDYESAREHGRRAARLGEQIRLTR